MAKVKGIFVVTPAQFTENENVSGLAFPSAGKAQTFAVGVQKAVRREAAKALGISLRGLEKDDPKRKELATRIKSLPTIGLDILLQQLDANGKPVGDPMEFDTLRDPIDGDDDDEE